MSLRTCGFKSRLGYYLCKGCPTGCSQLLWLCGLLAHELFDATPAGVCVRDLFSDTPAGDRNLFNDTPAGDRNLFNDTPAGDRVMANLSLIHI